jgi:hypothetical protein
LNLVHCGSLSIAYIPGSLVEVLDVERWSLGFNDEFPGSIPQGYGCRFKGRPPLIRQLLRFLGTDLGA